MNSSVPFFALPLPPASPPASPALGCAAPEGPGRPDAATAPALVPQAAATGTAAAADDLDAAAAPAAAAEAMAPPLLAQAPVGCGRACGDDSTTRPPVACPALGPAPAPGARVEAEEEDGGLDPSVGPVAAKPILTRCAQAPPAPPTGGEAAAKPPPAPPPELVPWP